MRPPSSNRRQHRLSVAVVAISLLAACSVEPLVGAERSDLIDASGEPTGVAEPSDSFVVTLPQFDEIGEESEPTSAPATTEALGADDEYLEAPIDEYVEQMEEAPEPAPIPELPAASEILQLQIDPGVLTDPWWSTGDPSLKSGHEEREYQTNCDPASRFMDRSRHDHGTTTWRNYDDSTMVEWTVYAMTTAPEVAEAMADIDSIGAVCPSFTWSEAEQTVRASRLPDIPAGVASVALVSEAGYTSWFAARRSGRFLVSVHVLDLSTGDAVTDDTSDAFDVLVDEIVRMTSDTSPIAVSGSADPAWNDALLTERDLGPSWTVNEGYPPDTFGDTNPEACGLERIADLVVTAKHQIDFSRTADNLFGRQVVSAFASADDANDTVTDIALIGRCADETGLNDGIDIDSTRVAISGTDLVLDLSVAIDVYASRYILIRVGSAVTTIWLSRDGVLTEDEVAALVVTASARLVAAAN